MEATIIAALFGVIIFLISYALFVPRASENFKPAKDANSASMKIAGALGTELINSLPADYVHKKRNKTQIQHLIKRSGNPWRVTADEFFFLQFVSAFAGFILAWVLWAIFNFVLSVSWFFLIPIITILAFFWPRYKYAQTGRERDTEFKRQLPEALDMLQISLTSGRALPAGLRSAADEMRDSVLKDEFQSMVRRYESGMSMEATLDTFAASAPSEAIESFVKSVKQAQKLSVPMEETLKQRAAASRAEYIALIDKRIATLSTNIMSILAPTLIPAVMITVLAPSLFVIMDALGGGGVGF